MTAAILGDCIEIDKTLSKLAKKNNAIRRNRTVTSDFSYGIISCLSRRQVSFIRRIAGAAAIANDRYSPVHCSPFQAHGGGRTLKND